MSMDLTINVSYDWKPRQASYHNVMSASALSSTEGSPAESPVHSPTLSRRLSSRRGSISAADPWGTHAAVNLNPSRSSTSRLTIVRVPQAGEQQDSRYHRRHGSNASINSNSSKGEGGGRLSFAFSSFTPINSNPGGRASPTGSPRMRPASPGGFSGGGANLSRGPSLTLPSRDKLPPEKLVELARTSCHPRPQSGPGQPVPAPVSFTPLPDDVYLPFIDRPNEVAVLISNPPSAKLFALLSQTFPPESRASASANPAAPTPSVDSDSTKWSYAELENWLKKVSREEVNDAAWVRRARACVLPRSELIWERIKGALGIPPELDTDEPEEDPLAAYLPEPISIPRRGIPLTSDVLDSDVFEPDSPVVAADGSTNQLTVDVGAPDSPHVSELELSIEPILATPPPPPSMIDPTTGANMTSLQEVREEDEETPEEDAAESAGGNAGGEVHGLRISTSSMPSFSPDLGPLRSRGSFGAGRGASPSPVKLDEGTYDAPQERGPGHPLFPSSFAHLSTGPTLRTAARAASMSFPATPAMSLRRSDSHSAIYARGRNLRPEWARGWDAIKHEDAITTSSVSGDV